MFDCYYCIKTFCCLKTSEKIMLQKDLFFYCTYNGAERHVTCECFENATPRAKNVILTSQNYVCFCARVTDDISFCDSPRGLIHKPYINSTWIALLIHRFLLVKAWLLIVCDTAFYAIMLFNMNAWIVWITGIMRSASSDLYFSVQWFCFMMNDYWFSVTQRLTSWNVHI